MLTFDLIRFVGVQINWQWHVNSE